MIYHECQALTTNREKCSQPAEREPDYKQEIYQMKIEGHSMGGTPMYPLKKKRYCYFHRKKIEGLLTLK